jgi:hypothetical protein
MSSLTHGNKRTTLIELRNPGLIKANASQQRQYFPILSTC